MILPKAFAVILAGALLAIADVGIAQEKDGATKAMIEALVRCGVQTKDGRQVWQKMCSPE